MTPEEFDAAFDTFTTSVFRLEVHQSYAVSAEDPFVRAYREGLPRPERSIRTSPWLRRIAASTIAGKTWTRVRLVRHPLTEYLQHELLAFAESAVVGEEIRIVDLNRHPELNCLGPDFWLFDADMPSVHAIVMIYGDGGELVDSRKLFPSDACIRQRDRALAASVSLAEYLARGNR